MSRGFQLANVDVGILQDPKMVKLIKLVPDEGERAATVLVYEQTMLESWRVGERVTATEAEILWEATEARVSVLQRVGLLDDEGRVTESAWEKYYGAALRRIEKRSSAGRMGGLASWSKRKRSSSDASPPPERPSSNGRAAVNLTPADPPSPKGEAGKGRVGQRSNAPTRPPVLMDRLEDAETGSLEVMLRDLPDNDGRRGPIEAELSRRLASGIRAPPDLREEAEAIFGELGATWVHDGDEGPSHAPAHHGFAMADERRPIPVADLSKGSTR
jgi:hypothetical protein